MKSVIGGVLAGTTVSAIALGVLSVVTELPPGSTPPQDPMVAVDPVSPPPDADRASAQTAPVSGVVDSVTIQTQPPQEPSAPVLPGEGAANTTPDARPAPPQTQAAEGQTPQTDTGPVARPAVGAVDGVMPAPPMPNADGVAAAPIDPVLPNPQAAPPQTPTRETDVMISTVPAQPVFGQDLAIDGADAGDATDSLEETFVLDQGQGADPASDDVVQNAPIDIADDEILAVRPRTTPAPGLRFQGATGALPGAAGGGVTIRRPGDGAQQIVEQAPAARDALLDFAADAADAGTRPLMSFVLIDDGAMAGASAVLSGLPFSVSVAIDPAMDGADVMMRGYRDAGVEVLALAKVPSGAVPSDVEVTFESVFATLPETIAVLDIGEGGLLADPAVTAQVMDILAAEGRGFVTASAGLNTASRAADAANVRAATIYRDIDADGQDARMVRRSIDQAAFRARQDGDVVLVGRMRPDTISALILWGAANSDTEVAVVPVSAVLLED